MVEDGDVVDLARLTLERDWHVRFIELMPLGGGECARVSTTRYVSNYGTRARIEEALGALEMLEPIHPSDEARNYRLRGGRGVVGFISPVSEPFCGSCNRMRLTSDGRFHLCLLNDDEIVELARWAALVEQHYERPMDMEWARDGVSGELYLVQARPETVQALRSTT